MHQKIWTEGVGVLSFSIWQQFVLYIILHICYLPPPQVEQPQRTFFALARLASQDGLPSVLSSLRFPPYSSGKTVISLPRKIPSPFSLTGVSHCPGVIAGFFSTATLSLFSKHMVEFPHKHRLRDLIPRNTTVRTGPRL